MLVKTWGVSTKEPTEAQFEPSSKGVTEQADPLQTERVQGGFETGQRTSERPRPRQIEDGGDDDVGSIGQQSSEGKIGAGLHPKPVQQHEGMALSDRLEAEGGRRPVAAHGVMLNRPGGRRDCRRRRRLYARRPRK